MLREIVVHVTISPFLFPDNQKTCCIQIILVFESNREKTLYTLFQPLKADNDVQYLKSGFTSSKCYRNKYSGIKGSDLKY